MTVEERLEKIETLLGVLVERQQVREWYSVEEFAPIVGKAEFTVREWCRRGRLKAEKRLSGRGAHPAWVISHKELLRYQREGMLPPCFALKGLSTKQRRSSAKSSYDEIRRRAAEAVEAKERGPSKTPVRRP